MASSTLSAVSAGTDHRCRTWLTNRRAMNTEAGVGGSCRRTCAAAVVRAGAVTRAMRTATSSPLSAGRVRRSAAATSAALPPWLPARVWRTRSRPASRSAPRCSTSPSVKPARVASTGRALVVSGQRSGWSVTPSGGPMSAGTWATAPSGAAGVDIGGDWFDVVPLPAGAVGLIVGDVEGHDVEAAALMGLLRSAVRAYALEGHPPAVILDRSNQFLAGLHADRLVTVSYLQLHPTEHLVIAASAGHLPTFTWSRRSRSPRRGRRGRRWGAGGGVGGAAACRCCVSPRRTAGPG